MRTTPKSTLAAKYTSFTVLALYEIPTGATQNPNLCSSDCGMVLPPLPSSLQ